MDYKEIHQECYEQLFEKLGHEPTWQQVEEAFRDRISCIADYLTE